MIGVAAYYVYIFCVKKLQTKRGKGENTKEVGLGIKVFFHRLVSPNVSPKNAPYLGPKRTAPIITGIWTVVAFIKPSGMYPKKGTNAMITIIAAKAAAITMVRVFSTRFILSSLLLFFYKDTMHLQLHYI